MAAAPVYEDFATTSELVHEENCDTILLHLPDFKKEQLRVQLTKGGILRISGSRPIGDNKFRRFEKEFLVSENTDTSKISAKFEGGILYVKQPKLITQEDKHDQKTQPPKPASPQKPSVEPKARTDAPVPTDQQQPDKAQGSIEEKEPSGESIESIDSRKKNEVKEKKRMDKPETESSKAAEGRGGVAGNEDGVGLANYRDIAGAMASRLKMTRRVMNAVLVALLALLLAHYASNLIKKFAKTEN